MITNYFVLHPASDEVAEKVAAAGCRDPDSPPASTVAGILVKERLTPKR